MKKILIMLFVLSAFSAHADGRERHHHRHYYAGNSSGGTDLLLPLIIGGVVGYQISRANEPQQVIIQKPQPQPAPSIIINGAVYVEALQFEHNCNCYKKVYVPR